MRRSIGLALVFAAALAVPGQEALAQLKEKKVLMVKP
jgi:hypothetical protein